MNVVIVEDELDACKRLSRLITQVFKDAAIVAHLSSVQSAKEWFAGNAMPDMVFLDINLGDGSGFDVLNLVKLECPFIFTTAYDEYAIEAFQTNSIAYLLKPVTKQSLESVVKKMEDYLTMFRADAAQTQKGSGADNYKRRFIIRYGDHLKVIEADEIAYCYSFNKATYLRTFDNRSYNLDYTLDMLEEMLDPHVYFRINRQYLIHIRSIEEMRAYSKARILISLKPAVPEVQIVSTEKSAEFKHWLDDGN